MLKNIKKYKHIITGSVLIVILSLILTFGIQYVMVYVDLIGQIKEKAVYLIEYLEDAGEREKAEYEEALLDEERWNKEISGLIELEKSDGGSGDNEEELSGAFKYTHYDIFADEDALNGEKKVHDSTYYDRLLDDVELVDDAFIVLIDKNTGELIYSQNEKYSDRMLQNGKSAQAKGIEDIFLGTLNDCGDLTVWIYIPLTALLEKGSNRVQYQLIFFAVVIFLLAAYAAFLRECPQTNENEVRFGRKYYPRDLAVRYIGVASILGIFLISLTFVTQNISLITERFSYLEQVKGDSLDEANQDYEAKINEPALIENVQKCINIFLNDNPEYASDEGLDKIFEAMSLDEDYGIKYISLFDERGNTVATTSPYGGLKLLKDKDSSFYECEKLLVGRDNLTIEADADILGEKLYMTGIPYRDDSGDIAGIIGCFYKEYLHDDLNGKAIDYKDVQNRHLNLLTMGEGSYAFYVDDKGNILEHPDDAKENKNITELGLPEEMIGTDYQSDETIDGDTVLVAAKKVSTGNYIVAVQPLNWFNKVALSSTVKTLLLFVFIALLILSTGLGSKKSCSMDAPADNEENNEPDKKASADEPETFRQDTKIPEDDSIDLILMAPKFETEKKKLWSGKNPEEKLKVLVHAVLYVFAAIIIICYINRDKIDISADNRASILKYIFDGTWTRSFNMFAILANLLLILSVWATITWLTKALEFISRLMGGSGKTAFRLLSSVAKYSGAVACIYIAALNVGIDAKAALASMGIAAMAIGFGAKDMIADIFAGIFILFEGNYKVGDMIMMDGQWFWVKSIGIRTTRIEAWGHVKIINNSQMTGIINIENGIAGVNIDVPIHDSYSIEQVEGIFAEEMPALAANAPEGVQGPIYKGISGFDGHNRLYRIRIFVPDLWKGSAKRRVNKEIIEMLAKYDIQIAPVITDVKTHEEMV